MDAPLAPAEPPFSRISRCRNFLRSLLSLPSLIAVAPSTASTVLWNRWIAESWRRRFASLSLSKVLYRSGEFTLPSSESEKRQ